jgi:SNF2 family DNA or RNA helicase
MVEQFHYEKLFILNNVYNNTLIQSKTEFIKPNVIKTELYPHQKTLVQGMYLYRDKMTRGFLVGNEAINGKIGIIGDPAGTGKTLSLLTYLASYQTTFPRISCELSNHSSKYYFSHEMKKITDSSGANLIIVPHCLFGQWKNEIEKHTSMNYIAIETKRMIKGDDLAKRIVDSSFVLTTTSCYKYVQEYAILNGIEWNNIVIDEASSIYMNSSDPKFKFQFLWFMTNNWIPLLFKNPSVDKNTLYSLRERVKMNIEFEKWLIENLESNYDGSLVSSSFLKDYLPLA